MDTALLNGDFAINASGKIYPITSMAETLQRCKILLGVKQGSFCYNPQLGNNLHLLNADDQCFQGNALLLVKEALLPLPQVTVCKTTTTVIQDKILINITIQAYGQTAELEVSV